MCWVDGSDIVHAPVDVNGLDNLQGGDSSNVDKLNLPVLEDKGTKECSNLLCTLDTGQLMYLC